MRLRAMVAVVAILVAAVGCGGSGPQTFAGDADVLEVGLTPPQLCVAIEVELVVQDCHGLRLTNWDWDAVPGEHESAGGTSGRYHVVGVMDGEAFRLTQAARKVSEVDPDPAGPDFKPACDVPDVVDPSAGGAEWEDMSQDHGRFEIPGEADAWVSDPEGRWDGPFVGNVLVIPGKRAAALAAIRRYYQGRVCVVERPGPTLEELERVQEQVLGPKARAVLGFQGVDVDGRRGVVTINVVVATQAVTGYAHRRWGDLVEVEGALKPVSR